MTEPREVGGRIKHIRLRLNLTQVQFGQKLGVKKLAIAKYEAGRVPKLAMLNKIARLGGVTTSWFFASEPRIVKSPEIAVPRSLKNIVAKLLDELRASSSSTSVSARQRYEARSKELLMRCRRDLAEYRQMLGIGQRHPGRARKSSRPSE